MDEEGQVMDDRDLASIGPSAFEVVQRDNFRGHWTATKQAPIHVCCWDKSERLQNFHQEAQDYRQVGARRQKVQACRSAR